MKFGNKIQFGPLDSFLLVLWAVLLLKGNFFKALFLFLFLSQIKKSLKTLLKNGDENFRSFNKKQNGNVILLLLVLVYAP